MKNYTDMESFLERFAAEISWGVYTKSNFRNALDESEWLRLVSELAGKDTQVKAGLIGSLHIIGILPPGPVAPDFTHRELSVALANRLDLIRFAKDRISGFTAVRH